MNSHVSTSLTVSSASYRVSVGDGNFTFSIDEHDNRSLLIPTRDFEVVAALFQRANQDWRRAKEIEVEANKAS